VSDYFEIDCASPYMLLVANVKPEFRLPLTEEQQTLFGIEKLMIITDFGKALILVGDIIAF
jgi:carbamoyltransferase